MTLKHELSKSLLAAVERAITRTERDWDAGKVGGFRAVALHLAVIKATEDWRRRWQKGVFDQVKRMKRMAKRLGA